jgi:hypothetical protein
MKTILVLVVVLLTSCAGTLKGDLQSALNVTERVGQATSDNAVILCDLAEHAALQAPAPKEAVAQVRLKCDALYSLLESIGALQTTAQAALVVDDLASAQVAYVKIVALVPQAKKLVNQLAESF